MGWERGEPVCASEVGVVVGIVRAAPGAGPTPAEPHPAGHHQADVWGLQHCPPTRCMSKAPMLVKVSWQAEQCAALGPVHLRSQRAAGDGTTRTIPASGG